METTASSRTRENPVNTLRVFLGLTLIVTAAVAGGALVAEALLLGLGALLLFAEIALLPGFGVAGVAALLMLAGGAAIYLGHPQAPSSGELLLGAAFAVTGIAVVVRYAPRIRFFRELIPDTLPAAPAPPAPPAAAPPIGATGFVVKPLRPVGVVRVCGVEWEATSERHFLDVGQAVRIESCGDDRIVVRPAGESAALERQKPAA